MIFTHIPETTTPDHHGILYVLAGNYGEYSRFIRKYEYGNGVDARYIQDGNTYRGVRGGSFIRIGSWASKKGVVELLSGLDMSEFTDITERFIRDRVKTQNTVTHLMGLFHSDKSWFTHFREFD